MKKQILAVMAAAALSLMAGCNAKTEETQAPVVSAQENQAPAASAQETQTEKASEEETKKDAEETEKAEESSAEASAASEEILVAAAASLKNAYEEQLIPMFQEEHPDITVIGTYDSSGKLQAQIEEGLEADLFMSAAVKQMDALNEEGMIASETITNLLENKIVLIVPAGSGAELAEFGDIGKAESIALGDPESVPAGQYAKEALASLGIWEEIQPKVSFGTNVTEVLNQVAAASADAGIVYATDAASMEDQVSVVAEAPEGSLAEKVIYPAAVVKESAHQEAAEAFLEFLKTPEAMEVFQSYGFSRAE